MMIAKRGIRVMIKGAAIVNGCYLMILWLVFSIDMAVSIVLGVILLILVDTPTATATTLNIATNTTAWTTIVVFLLKERHSSILIIRNRDFDWADIVDQHVICLTQCLGVLVNIADIIILYIGNEIAISFRISMQKEVHGDVFLANNCLHGCNCDLISSVTSHCVNPFCNKVKVSPNVTIQVFHSINVALESV